MVACDPTGAIAEGRNGLAPRPSWQIASVWERRSELVRAYRLGPGPRRPFVVAETSGRGEHGPDEHARGFGGHIRSLRRARGITQEVLAHRCGLSPDTIRRIEHGSLSPSLTTLRKLCAGLELQLSTLFESYELAEHNETRELHDLLVARGPSERAMALRLLRALFADPRGPG